MSTREGKTSLAAVSNVVTLRNEQVDCVDLLPRTSCLTPSSSVCHQSKADQMMMTTRLEMKLLRLQSRKQLQNALSNYSRTGEKTRAEKVVGSAQEVSSRKGLQV